ncbi:MAG: hypothetical protein ACTSR2_01860 [Candidatus Hodarchaeales archaeon]
MKFKDEPFDILTGTAVSLSLISIVASILRHNWPAFVGMVGTLFFFLSYLYSESNLERLNKKFLTAQRRLIYALKIIELYQREIKEKKLEEKGFFKDEYFKNVFKDIENIK